MGPLFGIFHRDVVRRLVDDRTFERGQAYVAQGRVGEVTRHEQKLEATVHGKGDYHVEIRVRGNALAYSCTCPVGAESELCKHCVAVVLTWIAQVAPEHLPDSPPPPAPPAFADMDALADACRALPRERLLELLLDEAATDAAFCQRLARRIGNE